MQRASAEVCGRGSANGAGALLPCEIQEGMHARDVFICSYIHPLIRSLTRVRKFINVCRDAYIFKHNTYMCTHKRRYVYQMQVCIYACMYGCMDGSMDGWMDGCTCVF
jgi:hypothetical protein